MLVTGAGAGIGRLLVELLSALNAEVTAVVDDHAQALRAVELGAERAVLDIAAVAGPFDIVYEAAEGVFAAAERGWWPTAEPSTCTRASPRTARTSASSASSAVRSRPGCDTSSSAPPPRRTGASLSSST
ncbi:hypothetical protein ACFQ3Z_20585 [Streptomyces nogalater]